MYKPVLKPSDAEGHMLTYRPKAINTEVPEQAKNFIRSQEEDAAKNPFKINELVSETTGLSDIERRSFADRVEREVLNRLKIVEEKAYTEAYALGLDDGRKKAYNDTSKMIQESVDNAAHIVQEVSNLKSQMFIENEAHFVETIFHLVKTLAFKAIDTDPSLILSVLKKALENAQDEEEITIRLNPKDEEYLKSVKGETGNPLEKISKVKIEPSENVTRGGCILETNYGVIDATIEQRVNKLWAVIEGKVPQITDET